MHNLFQAFQMFAIRWTFIFDALWHGQLFAQDLLCKHDSCATM